MLDQLDLPINANGNLQIFNCNSIYYYFNAWQTWVKPRGATMCYIFAIGSGGGGGSGIAGSNNNVSGGAGGGSAASVSLVIQANHLPDFLYISVPNGGAGGSGTTGSGDAGVQGGFSFITVAPEYQNPPITTPNNTLVCSGLPATPAGGGGKGVSGGSSVAGAAGAVTTLATTPLLGIGYYTLLVGQAGAICTVTGIGGSRELVATGACTTAGAAGGSLGNAGTTRAGGTNGLTSSVWSLRVEAGAGSTGAAIPGGPGGNGVNSFSKLGMSCGGAGGGGGYGTGASATGGIGGAGGIGGGGGGGGSHLTGVGVNPAGGRGGDGLVYIYSW